MVVSGLSFPFCVCARWDEGMGGDGVGIMGELWANVCVIVLIALIGIYYTAIISEI